MDTLSAMTRNAAARAARAARAAGDVGKVFDWAKAARLIQERSPREASAGLRHDWEWTGGVIWRDGQPVPREETYTYLASSWAIPELRIDEDVVECWVDDDLAGNPRGWDAHTYWPDLAALRGAP